MKKVNEINIDELWNEITSGINDREKIASSSSENIDVNELIEELEKVASEIIDNPDVITDIKNNSKSSKKIPKKDGTGKGIRANKGRSGCDNTEPEGLGQKIPKLANADDVKKIEEESVGGSIMLRSDSPVKQRLKEIALMGIKEGKETPEYNKLRKLVLNDEDNEKTASSDNNIDNFIEKLSDKVVEYVIGSV